MTTEIVDIKLRGLQRLLDDFPLYAQECLRIVTKAGAQSLRAAALELDIKALVEGLYV